METGIFAGPGSQGVAFLPVYATWLGSPAQRVTENFAQDTWTSMVSDAGWSASCYAAVRNSVNMTFSVPMLPADGVSTLAQGAAGAYDQHFTDIATSLVTNGFATATVRIGWEFNGNWQPWDASKDPTNWVTFYRRIVGLMRAVPGARFLFDWCPNVGTGTINPETVYPGDDVVDYIGIDIYIAHYNSGDETPVARWNNYVNQANGLQWQVNFAKTHMKRLSMPEWGACGNNTGDDPTTINLMAKWLRNNSYAYAVYWESNAAGYSGQLSQGQWPCAAVTYIANFR